MKGIFADNKISFDIKEQIKSGGLNEFKAFALNKEIDEIYYTRPLTYTKRITDLVNFLTYVSEPSQLDRYKIGFWVILFLTIFAFIAYLLKKEYWKDIE